MGFVAWSIAPRLGLQQYFLVSDRAAVREARRERHVQERRWLELLLDTAGVETRLNHSVNGDRVSP